MHFRRVLAGYVWAAVLCGMVSTMAMASEGVFLLGNDAQHLGRAGSGIASPRSSYWSYLNPASMVDLERRLDVNWYSVFTDVELEPRGLLGNRLNGDMESTLAPNIFSSGFIYPLEVGVLGGGIFIPSGSGVDYEGSRTWFSRIFQGNTDRRLSYQHIRGVLSYAYPFDNGWAIGASLHGSISRFRTDHLTLSFNPCRGDFEWDSSLGAGFGLGIYKSWERFSIGAAYSSRHWTETMDKYTDLLANALDTPRVVQAGFAWKLRPNLEFTADYKWLNWKAIPSYGKPLSKGGFNWDDQHGVKLGLEWTVHPKWTLMGGFAHSTTPIDEDHAFLSALVPVTVEDHYTGGVTYRITDHHHVHLVGVYAPHHAITDTGKGDIFSVVGKGSTISASALSFCLGYSYLW